MDRGSRGWGGASRSLSQDALAGIDDVVVTAGGDCGVDLAPIAAARARHGDRAGDTTEHEYLQEAGIRRYGVGDFEKALDDLDGPVYVHIDLDVLEPTEFGSLGYREPDGVSPDRLIDLVSRLHNVVGAAITEHMPTGDASDAGDAEVIRRLAAALPC